MFFLILFFASLQLIFSNAPIFIVVIITLSALLVTLHTLNVLSWFSYFIFLIFVGGMMILFMYIVSLSKNESSKMNFLWTLFPLGLGLSTFNYLNKFKAIPDLPSIFSMLNFEITLMSIVYLFMMLMMAIKIIYFNQAPMRSSK